MLVETKAKVGVFSIALGAYLPQFPTLVPEFEAQYEAFKKTIPDTVELVDGGIVTTKELSMKAGQIQGSGCGSGDLTASHICDKLQYASCNQRFKCAGCSGKCSKAQGTGLCKYGHTEMAW